MSSEKKPMKNVQITIPNRHPALVRRDALYAESRYIPRLTERGKEVISNVPLATDLLGLRPLSMEEQIARFSGHGIVDWSLVPDIDEDDWQDIMDDVDEFEPEGITPHELTALRNQERYFNRGLKAADKPPADPGTTSGGSAERPHEAGDAEPTVPAQPAK